MYSDTRTKGVLILIGILIGINSCFVLTNKISLYILIGSIISIGILTLLIITKFNIEKSMIIGFSVMFPFMTELNLFASNDFHIMSKTFYRLNYLHLFCIYFLVQIIKNKRKVNMDIDILFLVIFNIICILGGLNSLSFDAFLFEYLKYACLSIVYIYFSRVCNYENYLDIVYKCLALGLIIQFIVGLFQILKGGRLGLTILGEGFEVFRIDVNGYEKGFSGTFGHPGPFALYANLILILFLFRKNIKRIPRIVGIVTSTIIVIVAAGRTSIVVMGIIYGLYFINDALKLNMKSVLFMILLLIFASCIFFSGNLDPVISRFLESDIDKQVQNRVEHLMYAIPYIKQNPFIGIGLNNYMDHTLRDHPILFEYNFYLSNPIHNAFMSYIVEVGIVGSFIFILFMLNNFRMYTKVKNKLNYNQLNVLKGNLLIIIAWSIYGMQGWGGLQTRSLMILFFSFASIYKNYNINKSIYRKEELASI